MSHSIPPTKSYENQITAESALMTGAFIGSVVVAGILTGGPGALAVIGAWAGAGKLASGSVTGLLDGAISTNMKKMAINNFANLYYMLTGANQSGTMIKTNKGIYFSTASQDKLEPIITSKYKRETIEMTTTYETKTITKDGAKYYLLVYTDPIDKNEKFDIKLVYSSTDTQLQQMYYQSMLMYQYLTTKVITLEKGRDGKEEKKEEIGQDFRWYIPLKSFVSINKKKKKESHDYIRFNRVENTKKKFNKDLETYKLINKEIERKLTLQGIIKAKQLGKRWKKNASEKAKKKRDLVSYDDLPRLKIKF
tara:strand:+ start:1286 stop:2209 length:924 start_codon:yes stop_codon:yes gene_type:complete